MTGAFVRVERDNAFTSVEIEHLTTEEREELFMDSSNEELIRWIHLLSNTIKENEIEFIPSTITD